MGRWSHRLIDEVTIAPKQKPNQAGVPQYGTQSTISARIMEDAEREMGANGETVNLRDVFVTHSEITENYYVWLPGADTTDTDEALTPSNVRKGRPLGGGDAVYEVIL